MSQNSYPFCGRSDELDVLRASLEAATDGCPQVCVVRGSNGAGKTRLIREFAAMAGATLVATQCDSRTGDSNAYKPFKDALRLLTGGDESAGRLAEREEERQPLFTLAKKVLNDLAPDLIGALLPGSGLLVKMAKSIASQGAERILAEDAAPDTKHDVQLSSRQLYQQYTDVLTRVAEAKPLIFVVEDAQWLDASSRAYLSHIVGELRQGRILFLLSFEVAAGQAGTQAADSNLSSLTSLACCQDLDLDLAGEHCRRFTQDLIDGEPNQFDDAFRQVVFERTGGHARSVVHLMLELRHRQDVVKSSSGEWCASVQIEWSGYASQFEDVVARQLAELGEAELALLEHAAVAGQRFRLPVVSDALALPLIEAVKSLDRIERDWGFVKSGRSYRRGGELVFDYEFTNSLVARELYERLPRNARFIAHDAVAHQLERVIGPDDSEGWLQLAYHFERGLLFDKAIDYYRKASDVAARVSAHVEVVRLLDRCLSLQRHLPESDAKSERELDILLKKGASVIALSGYSAPELESIYQRARQVAMRSADGDDGFPALWGLWAYYVVRTDFEVATEIASQMQSIGARSADESIRIEALHASGVTAFNRGRFEESQSLLDQGLELWDPGRHVENAYVFGQDVQVALMSWSSWAHCFLGESDVARQLATEAEALGRERSHLFSRGFAMVFHAMLHHFEGRHEPAGDIAREVEALAAEHGFAMWQHWAAILVAWSAAKAGEEVRGIEGPLAVLAANGVQIWVPYFEAVWAGLMCDQSRLSEAESWLERSLDAYQPNGARFYDSDLLHVRGRVDELRGQSSDASAHYENALRIARKQGNRSYLARRH